MSVEEGGSGGGSFAEKMMRKMGWKEGKGLGARNQVRLRDWRQSQEERVTEWVCVQGMSTALDTQRTGRSTGKIVNMESLSKSGFGTKGAPSRCVLLTNMVAPSEVSLSLSLSLSHALFVYTWRALNM